MTEMEQHSSMYTEAEAGHRQWAVNQIGERIEITTQINI
jgi:hypothetical protein